MIAKINQELPFIPAWQSDESLYSWASSFHQVFGNGSHRDTGTLLFGTAHACKERDAPTGIPHFVRATGGSLGDLPKILQTRCSIGLFIPFLTPAKRKAFLGRTEMEKGPGWMTTLGMAASGFSPSSHLRYCESCIRNDLANRQLPKWRRPHQLAASWICTEHSRLLKTTVCRSFTWTLPDLAVGEYMNTDPTTIQLESLRRLSKLTQFVALQQHLNLSAIRQSVLCELRRQDISSWAHPISKRKLASWFASSPLAEWLRTAHSPEASLATGTWIHDLLRGRREDHPLKWLLLWATLFAHEQDLSSQRRLVSPWTEPQWDAIGQSSFWIEEKKSLPSNISQIILDARTLKEASKALGLTASELRNRLMIRSESGGSFRRAKGNPQRRENAVNSILDFIEGTPNCTLVEIHRECKAAVSWLRDNSPEDFATATQELQRRSLKQLRLF